MELSVFTWPGELPNEAGVINELFYRGLECLHLRKPDWNYKETKKFLQSIEKNWHHKIILSQHFEMIEEFNLMGIHFSKRYTINDYHFIFSKKDFLLSTSIHNLTEYNNLPNSINRVYISPVFNSISKKGHYGKFKEFDLKKFIINNVHKNKFFALGGIHVEHIQKVHDLGFKGAGVLGAIWLPYQELGKGKALETFDQLRNKCKKYHIYE